MRISASGLASTIAVAIDQILRLAPSISAAHRAGGVEHERDFDGRLCNRRRQAGRERKGSESERKDAKGSNWLHVLLRCSVPWNRNSPGFTVP